MMLLSFILGFGWLKFFYSYGIWIDVASILNAVEQLCLIPIPLLTGYYLYRKGNRLRIDEVRAAVRHFFYAQQVEMGARFNQDSPTIRAEGELI
jgi:hypothetical protein